MSWSLRSSGSLSRLPKRPSAPRSYQPLFRTSPRDPKCGKSATACGLSRGPFERTRRIGRLVDGRVTLETRNLSQVLIWVQADDEREIRAAFEQTLIVRALSPQGQELADRYFFETVVRVHRAGEGASYTGLKPAGRDLGPAIPAADKALEEGSLGPVVTLLTKGVEDGLRRHFEEVITAKHFKPGDLSAGREYIKAYVEFIHYVERLYEAITTPAHSHVAEAATAEGRH
jgi:Family of unknown function (DUF6448)